MGSEMCIRDRLGVFGLRGKVGPRIAEWQPLIANTDVARSDVAADGAGGGGNSPRWANKTGRQIMRDVVAALSAVKNATEQTIEPNTVLLPPAPYDLIQATEMSEGSGRTILSWMMEQLKTGDGMDIEIQRIRELAGAGNGGTDRMAVYRKDPRITNILSLIHI